VYLECEWVEEPERYMDCRRDVTSTHSGRLLGSCAQQLAMSMARSSGHVSGISGRIWSRMTFTDMAVCAQIQDTICQSLP
jgi:hypothetical protein